MKQQDRNTRRIEAIEAIRRNLSTGRVAEAEATAKAARAEFPQSAQIFFLSHRVAAARDDHPASVDCLRKAVSLANDAARPRMMAALANALVQCGHKVEAQTVLKQALVLDPTSQEALFTAARMDELNGDFESAVQRLRVLVEQAGSTRRGLFKLVHLELEMGRPRDALQTIDLALSLGEEVTRLLRLKMIAATRIGDYETAREAVQALLGHSGVTDSLRTEATRYQGWLSSALDLEGLNDVGEDVMVRGCEGSDTIVFVFTGLSDQLSMIPLVELHARLMRLGVSAVYLKDRRRTLYLDGLEGLAPDYEGCVEALRQMAADHSAKRILCMGGSAGVYASIKYALDLGAEASLALAGPTNLEEQAIMEDGREAPALALFRKRNPHRCVNLRPQLAASSLTVHAYFCDDHQQDAAHARNIEGLSNVRLFPQDGPARHDVGALLVEQGRFDDVLRDFIAVTGESEQSGATRNSACEAI